MCRTYVLVATPTSPSIDHHVVLYLNNQRQYGMHVLSFRFLCVMFLTSSALPPTGDYIATRSRSGNMVDDPRGARSRFIYGGRHHATSMVETLATEMARRQVKGGRHLIRPRDLADLKGEECTMLPQRSGHL